MAAYAASRPSHIMREGMPSLYGANDIATISASQVDSEVQPCFFDTALSGTNVRGPTTARKTPDVLRASTLSPARSASQNSAKRHCPI